MTWHLRAVALPDDDSARDQWVDRDGRLTNHPDPTAEELPGSYVIHGLVDAHAHLPVAKGPTGPVARDRTATLTTLAGWAAAGITMVRDVGSPGGLTLTLDRPPRSPRTEAAGRFLAPEDQYFPELLPVSAPERELTRLALAEVDHGAMWVKVIGDFPLIANGKPSGLPQRTYSREAMTSLVAAVHAAWSPGGGPQHRRQRASSSRRASTRSSTEPASTRTPCGSWPALGPRGPRPSAPPSTTGRSRPVWSPTTRTRASTPTSCPHRGP